MSHANSHDFAQWIVIVRLLSAVVVTVFSIQSFQPPPLLWHSFIQFLLQSLPSTVCEAYFMLIILGMIIMRQPLKSNLSHTLNPFNLIDIMIIIPCIFSMHAT